MNKGQALSRAKTVYARGVRQAGTVLARVGIIGDEPPPREARVKHWAYSLTRVRLPLAIAELDVPCWTYRAIDTVDTWLRERRRPIRAFEYGSGASTIWLARRTDEAHSVEHDRAFGDHIAPTLREHANVELHIAEATKSAAPAMPSAKETHAGIDFTGLDFANYVATINKVGGQFDLVVIDGRAREACLTAAVPHLAPDGLIVFDNTRRRRYRDAIAMSGVDEQVLRGLTPTLPYPEQTSLLTLHPSAGTEAPDLGG